MKSLRKNLKEIVVYQAPNGAIELRGDVAKETIWATQAHIAEIFDTERSVITKHIRNVLKDKELDETSVCAKFAHTADDGKVYQVQFYNLDIILAVGYRTSSRRAVEFRKWATKTLREHILEGYTINRKRIARNYDSFLRAVESVRTLLPSNMKADTGNILELIKTFADTWFSLDAYDRGSFKSGKATKKRVSMTARGLMEGIAELRNALRARDEAAELFATERTSGSIEGIVGNIMQSFGGKEVYPSLEEKAAHLLYFMVKNHPFADGNKRCGAFAFVWFLKKAGVLDTRRLTPEALTALTLLVAESDPKEKDKMIGLILLLLTK